MSSVPKLPANHVSRVTRLYRHALKNLMNWATGLKHEMVLSPPPSQEQKRVQQRVTGREARIARQAFERKKKLVAEMQAKKKARGAAAPAAPSAAAPTAAAQ